jgi:formylmethanofuran dehydrogenase subunit A
MSKKAREAVLADIKRSAKKRMDLPAIDTEWTMKEYITSTRAGPAKILGLPNKGHLGVGADADVGIYDLDPAEDFAKHPEKLIRGLIQAWMTIKGGRIVQKEGKMVAIPKGSTHWIDAQIEPDLAKEVENDIREKFMSAYTIAFENYPVSKRYLHRSAAVKLEASS